MSVTRRGKRGYIWVISGSILLVVLCCCFWSISIIKHKNEKNEKIEMYILCCEKEEGMKLNESDLKKVTVKEADFQYCGNKKELIGKFLKIHLDKGTVLNQSMVTSKTDEDDNLRKTSYSYIKLTGDLSKGNYVDVRISFPNGADFVVLAKKKVIDISGNEQGQSGFLKTLHFALSEEEIMRMSSGVVDAYLTEGAYLYTVQYINDMQTQAVVNYPVNEVVRKLMAQDPNIIEKAKDSQTAELRSKIYDSFKGQNENVNGIDTENGLTYFH